MTRREVRSSSVFEPCRSTLSNHLEGVPHGSIRSSASGTTRVLSTSWDDRIGEIWSPGFQGLQELLRSEMFGVLSQSQAQMLFTVLVLIEMMQHPGQLIVGVGQPFQFRQHCKALVPALGPRQTQTISVPIAAIFRV